MGLHPSPHHPFFFYLHSSKEVTFVWWVILTFFYDLTHGTKAPKATKVYFTWHTLYSSLCLIAKAIQLNVVVNNIFPEQTLGFSAEISELNFFVLGYVYQALRQSTLMLNWRERFRFRLDLCHCWDYNRIWTWCYFYLWTDICKELSIPS